MKFQDYYNERQLADTDTDSLSFDTGTGPVPYVGAATKTSQEYKDPALVFDYQMIVSTLRKLQHPKVQQKLYDWIKATFKKTQKGGSQMDIATDGSPDMYDTQDVITPNNPKSLFGLNTASTPKQISSFKGVTTKLGKKNKK